MYRQMLVPNHTSHLVTKTIPIVLNPNAMPDIEERF